MPHPYLDKPARLSFSCSLDLLLNASDIDQININRDIRDGNWHFANDYDCWWPIHELPPGVLFPSWRASRCPSAPTDTALLQREEHPQPSGGFWICILCFDVNSKLRTLLKQNTALLSTVGVSVCHRRDIYISHIYKGINAMLIIRGPIKPYIFWIKIFLAIFLAKTRPDKTIFSALTNLTIDFDFKLSKV